ncbi:hypothetical protein Ga0466249_000943 [Sporomusaceae bacterium BoRhaA]|nr:hypothetical protein [Pelorhabdus rhamnosifermentans]
MRLLNLWEALFLFRMNRVIKLGKNSMKVIGNKSLSIFLFNRKLPLLVATGRGEFI